MCCQHLSICSLYFHLHIVWLRGVSPVAQWLRICLQCKRCKRWVSDPWVWKIPWRMKWPPTPGFLPGKSHGPRGLAGYSPQSRQESDVTEQQSTNSCMQAAGEFFYKVVIFISQTFCRKTSPQSQSRRWSLVSSTVYEASLLSLTPFVPVSALFVGSCPSKGVNSKFTIISFWLTLTVPCRKNVYLPTILKRVS